MKLVIFDLDDTLFSRSEQIKEGGDIEKIVLFPDAGKVLDAKGFLKILATRGNRERQERKIDVLGIREKFDMIMICEKEEDKKACFEKAVQKYGLEKNDIFVVGNRIDSEIKYANMLGLQSVLFVHGYYSNLEPKDGTEVPKYKIKILSEILDIIGAKK